MWGYPVLFVYIRISKLYNILKYASSQVREVVREINQVADYARRFNRHVAEQTGEEDAPRVRVAVCYACFAPGLMMAPFTGWRRSIWR